MITIEWFDLASFGIGAGLIIVLYLLLSLITRKRKSKVDLHNLKKVVHDAGMEINSAYKKLQELEKMFIEMEKAG